jgi:transposase
MAATAEALPDDVEALKAALLAERARCIDATARALQVEAELARARAQASDDQAMIAHQQLQIAKLQRELYGPRSERAVRLIDQMELGLEEHETSATEDEIAAEAAAARTTNVAAFARKRPSRQPFPEHLPRERVVEPAPIACRCCGGARLRKLGEDVTETLEVIPRSWKVIQHVREKFSCRDCEKISQPPAPFHVTPRGWAGPSLLAMLVFEKFGQHQPLNRQAERYAREGVPLSLSTLADQVGACCAVLAPLLARLEIHVFAAERLHGDDTKVPVLARGKTITHEVGSMCATIARLAGLLRRRRCSTTRATAAGSIRRRIWPTMPACSRPTPIAAMASFTNPTANPGRSWKRPAGCMRAGRSSYWLMSRLQLGARPKERHQA